MRHLQKLYQKAKYNFARFTGQKPLLSYWWRGVYNVGDCMGPLILSRLFKEQVFHKDDLPSLVGKKNIIVSVGSILQVIDFGNPVIWGTGIINPEEVPILQNPCFLSVRGPLTRNAILKAGYQCPSIFGDPALILARYSKFEEMKKESNETQIGLVLHYVDKNMETNIDKDKVNIIDVQQGVDRFARQISNQDIIMSTSLHGIITAHAFGIPAIWLRKTDNKTGGDFKYEDYIYSFGNDIIYHDVNDKIDIKSVLRNIDNLIIEPPQKQFIDNIQGAIFSKKYHIL